MLSTQSTQSTDSNALIIAPEKQRQAIVDKAPSILADIYQDNINIAVWQRELSENLKLEVQRFLNSNPKFQSSLTVSPQNALSSIQNIFGPSGEPELSKNIAELVDMFCCLFELKHAGLRITALSKAMCPRFHVDRVPCRLVTTYQGIATEWLPHEAVDRTKLGTGNKGKAEDKHSGLFQNEQDIHQLGIGDVALLKGERWEGNEGAGLVHRSPTPAKGETRLLLTLDLID